MPNTPASIGAGISAIFADPNIPAKRNFGGNGGVIESRAAKVVHVASEAELNAVTAISGSGPAYVFHLVEALEVGARDLGLPKEVASKIGERNHHRRCQILGSASEDGPCSSCGKM